MRITFGDTRYAIGLHWVQVNEPPGKRRQNRIAALAAEFSEAGGDFGAVAVQDHGRYAMVGFGPASEKGLVSAAVALAAAVDDDLVVIEEVPGQNEERGQAFWMVAISGGRVVPQTDVIRNGSTIRASLLELDESLFERGIRLRICSRVASGWFEDESGAKPVEPIGLEELLEGVTLPSSSRLVASSSLTKPPPSRRILIAVLVVAIVYFYTPWRDYVPWLAEERVPELEPVAELPPPDVEPPPEVKRSPAPAMSREERQERYREEVRSEVAEALRMYAPHYRLLPLHELVASLPRRVGGWRLAVAELRGHSVVHVGYVRGDNARLAMLKEAFPEAVSVDVNGDVSAAELQLELPDLGADQTQGNPVDPAFSETDRQVKATERFYRLRLDSFSVANVADGPSNAGIRIPAAEEVPPELSPVLSVYAWEISTPRYWALPALADELRALGGAAVESISIEFGDDGEESLTVKGVLYEGA